MSAVDQMRRDRNIRLQAERRKRLALAQLRGEPVGLVDAAPIRDKAKALVTLGWSLEAIIHAARADVTASGLRLIVNGVPRRCERKFQPVAALPITLHIPDSVPDTCLVPSLGAVRRVRALQAIGWRHDDISEHIARASHHLSTGRYPRILAMDWRIVAAAYDKLSAVDGGSVKTRTRAARSGFAPPLAWDSIDDPNETPTWGGRDSEMDPVIVMRLLEGRHVKANRAEREEAIRRWVEDGGSKSELCGIHGWAPDRYQVQTRLRLVRGGAA